MEEGNKQAVEEVFGSGKTVAIRRTMGATVKLANTLIQWCVGGILIINNASVDGDSFKTGVQEYASTGR